MVKRESKQKYVIIDCETGGLNPLENPITEIAILAVDKITFKEVNRWETLIKTYGGLKYEPQALKGTGITMDMINTGKPIDKAVEVMCKFFESLTPEHDRGHYKPLIVGHNVGFDIRFIKKAFEFCGKELYDYVAGSIEDIPGKKPREGDISRIDTLDLCRDAWEGEGHFKLIDCCHRIGLEVTDLHRAMNDVICTWRVLEFLMKRMRVQKTKDSAIKDKQDTELEKVLEDRRNFQF